MPRRAEPERSARWTDRHPRTLPLGYRRVQFLARRQDSSGRALRWAS